MMRGILVLATRNAGKVRELERILGQDLDLEVRSLSDYPEMPEIIEDGDSFEENARIKALAAARRLGVATCADDSGLEVPALGGEPGIRSARYAGSDASDEDNNALLLERMRSLEDPKERRGYFVCAAALALPDQILEDWGVQPPGDWDVTEDGISLWSGLVRVPGIVLQRPRGTGGFGYDPLLLYEDMGKTFAEMTVEEKNGISHRGTAFRLLVRQLQALS